MIDKAAWESLQKQMQKAGMLAQPSAAQQAMSVLQGAPEMAARLMVYLAAKQELNEMKNELGRLQSCVRELESILEQQGPAACGRSPANHTFVNWMVSLAESYYGLAIAFQAKNAMIPRVMMYLNGQHQKNALWKAIDSVVAQPLAEAPISKVLRDALAQSTKNVPGFLKP